MMAVGAELIADAGAAVGAIKPVNDLVKSAWAAVTAEHGLVQGSMVARMPFMRKNWNDTGKQVQISIINETQNQILELAPLLRENQGSHIYYKTNFNFGLRPRVVTLQGQPTCVARSKVCPKEALMFTLSKDSKSFQGVSGGMAVTVTDGTNIQEQKMPLFYMNIGFMNRYDVRPFGGYDESKKFDVNMSRVGREGRGARKMALGCFPGPLPPLPPRECAKLCESMERNPKVTDIYTADNFGPDAQRFMRIPTTQNPEGEWFRVRAFEMLPTIEQTDAEAGYKQVMNNGAHFVYIIDNMAPRL